MTEKTELSVAFPKPCDEDWKDMDSGQGCHRHCAVCERTVHDLEAMTFEEAQELLAMDEEACVRAKVGADGAIKLADRNGQGQRRLKAALGGAATLAMAACSSVDGPAVSPRFTVAGSVEPYQRNAQIILEGPIRSYKTRAQNDATFQFTNLKPGTYKLVVQDYCGKQTRIEQLQVGEDDVNVGKLDWEADCIIVGKMTPADPPSRA